MAVVTREWNWMPRRRYHRWRRGIRKHRQAAIVLAAYLAIFLFPSIFMGRVLSPNDIYRHYEPWSTGEIFVAQNPLIHDPPMAYMPVIAMLERAPASFHWNPWLASGIPGWGSAASAMTPFALLPALLPIELFYAGMILLKLLFAYFTAYMWLREERLGKKGAAIGALVCSACGSMYALWLWQSTNATALYPAVLWAVARMSRGKRNSLVALTALGVMFLLSGYPAAIIFGVWLAAFYALVHFIRARRIPWRECVRAIAAIVLAVAIMAPLLEPFVGFLQRTGYLEWRKDMSELSFAPEHLGGLIDAEYLGSTARGAWEGDSRLGPVNNEVELTVWIGLLAAILIALSPLTRRERWLTFSWLTFGTLVILVMVGVIRNPFILDLPGLRFSPATRLRTLLPPAFGFLAAVGTGVVWSGLRRRISLRRASLVLLILGAALGYRYGKTAGSFYPYLRFSDAAVETTASLEFLQFEGEPFRVAPTFFWMMPNSSQMFGIEDIRSQWSSEAAYREIIRRVAPGAASENTVLLLNGLTMNVEDPFLPLLNVRYLIEPPAIDILQWRLGEGLEDGPVPDREVEMEPGDVTTSMVMVTEKARTVEVTSWPASAEDPRGSFVVESIDPSTGEIVSRMEKSGLELQRRPKIHLPLRDVFPGEAVMIRLEARGGSFVVPHLGERPFLRRSSSSLSLVWEGEDARIFELVTSLPRYRATWQLVATDPQAILADPSFSFEHRTVVGEKDAAEWRERFAAVPVEQRRVRFELLRYDPSDRVIRTSSEVPFLFTTSEKLTPELRMWVDGEPVEPLPVNGIFAGVPIEPGTHTIVLEWRIGREWWPWSVGGWIALALLGLADRRW